ncbi:hypothetical protein BDP27DRAFT_605343 [Rhodocollybia butyracea]|uniref:Uncharacterized protein n=1 Tax=Rhodocollybia butyracea TaxID=206335 RepID=A0A9P5Q3A8_9AGAR|nr:hypothetical protein BDP27DRAFT_605343 [Rhodocollybia butyracea]
MSNYAHSELKSSSQDTLHSLSPKTLSSNMRAYQALHLANEAKEILPIARILSDDFEFHNLSPVSPFRDSESARKKVNSIVCTEHLLVQNKEQYLQDKINYWDKVDLFGIVEVHQLIEAGNVIITDVGPHRAVLHPTYSNYRRRESINQLTNLGFPYSAGSLSTNSKLPQSIRLLHLK